MDPYSPFYSGETLPEEPVNDPYAYNPHTDPMHPDYNPIYDPNAAEYDSNAELVWDETYDPYMDPYSPFYSGETLPEEPVNDPYAYNPQTDPMHPDYNPIYDPNAAEYDSSAELVWDETYDPYMDPYSPFYSGETLPEEPVNDPYAYNPHTDPMHPDYNPIYDPNAAEYDSSAELVWDETYDPYMDPYSPFYSGETLPEEPVNDPYAYNPQTDPMHPDYNPIYDPNAAEYDSNAELVWDETYDPYMDPYSPFYSGETLPEEPVNDPYAYNPQTDPMHPDYNPIYDPNAAEYDSNAELVWDETYDPYMDPYSPFYSGETLPEEPVNDPYAYNPHTDPMHPDYNPIYDPNAAEYDSNAELVWDETYDPYMDPYSPFYSGETLPEEPVNDPYAYNPQTDPMHPDYNPIYDPNAAEYDSNAELVWDETYDPYMDPYSPFYSGETLPEEPVNDPYAYNPQTDPMHPDYNPIYDPNAAEYDSNAELVWDPSRLMILTWTLTHPSIAVKRYQKSQ